MAAPRIRILPGGLTTAISAVVLACMVWLGSRSDSWLRGYDFGPPQSDYYSLLVHGLLHGHLYMDSTVDPGLSSPDPDVRRHASYLLDASLYQGRYYLYFGVVPAALAFLPYHLLTGHDAPENAVGVLVVFLGFLVYARIYGEAQRRYFPNLSRTAQACSLLLLAFGSGTPAVATVSGWYEIAIAGGYACLAVAWLGVFQALHSERHPAAWLSLAGAAVGLAVGCRPTYVLVLPVLAGAILLIGRAVRPGYPRARLAAGAILPAGLVGLLLAAYNYARFGNPLEFGLRYQMSLTSVMSPRFIWTNLKGYYLQWPALSPYFPYVFPIHLTEAPPGYASTEAGHGQWPVLLLGLSCALLAIPVWRRERAVPGRLAAFLLLLGGGFACMLAGLACFGGRTDRYVADFQPSLVLLLALLGGYCAWRDSSVRIPLRLKRAGFLLLAAVAVLHNVLASLQLADRFQNVRPRSYHFLAHYGNIPVRLLTRLGVLHYGPIRFKMIFAPVTRETEWPLIATGLPGYADVLYATQHPDGWVVFTMNHTGYGAVSSAPFPIEPGRAYDLEADLGSLYPPRDDPGFAGWSDRDVDRLKTGAVVQFDGKTAIDQRIRFYDAPPNRVYLGRNPDGRGEPFSGRIFAIERLPPHDRASLASLFEPGVWRLKVTFQPSPSGQPVLGSGVTGHGNLLFLTVLPNQTVRFELDQWGLGLDRSPPVKISPPGPHQLEIFVGPQVARQEMPDGWKPDAAAMTRSSGLLRVWLDGVPVWTDPVYINLDSYDWVTIGSNPQGFNTAAAFFAGSLEAAPYAPGELKKFVAMNLRETDKK